MQKKNGSRKPAVCVAVSDAELNASICRILDEHGWGARAALTGAAAMDIIDEQPGILLLLDYNLTDMTAREMLQALDERELNPPFIVMAGHGSESRAADMMNMGALDYIAKDAIFLDMLPRVVFKAFNSITMRQKLRRAEITARETEARYSELFNTLFDPIFVHDASGRILEANRAACWIYGYSHSELLSLNIAKISPQFLKQSPELYRVIDEKHHVVFESENKTRHNVAFPIEVHTSRIVFNGIPAYISIIRDITERRNSERTMELRLRFERVIADISARFVKDRDHDRAIEGALAGIGAFSGADRVFLFLFRDGGRFTDNTHEWCAPGIASQKKDFMNISTAAFPWWMDKLNRGEHIDIRGVADMPAEAASERRLLQDQGALALAAFPVQANGELTGFIGFDYEPRRIREFSEEDINMLGVVADMAGGLLERQAAENALSESEARFRRIAECAPAIILRWVPGYGIDFISSYIEELTGWTVAEITGNSGFLASKIHPEDVPQFLALLQSSALKAGKPPPLVLRMYSKENRMLLMELRVIPVFDEQGRLEAIEGIAIDITDRSKAEDNMRYLATFALENPNPIISMDLDGRVMFTNTPGGELLRALGHKAGHSLPKPIHELARGALVGNTKLAAEITVGEHYYSFTAAPFKHHGYITLYGTDVTAMKTAKTALRASEEHFRRIAENIPDGLFRWSITNGLEYASPACFRISGYTADELLNNPMQALENVFKCNPGLSEYFTKLIQGGLFTQSRELQFVRKDGEQITLDVRMADVRDENGGLLSIEGSVRDITEQKRSELERASLREQLLHAQKMEAVGALAGGVAHDFNNMLTIITAHAQLLALNKDPGHPDSPLLVPILESCRRARDLTAELLTLARKKQLDITMTSANSVVTELTDFLKRSFPKNIRLQTRLDPKSPLSAMDKAQVIQALLNICNNARDAMPSGGVLRVETAQVEIGQDAVLEFPGAKPGSYSRIHIADTGEGISEDILPKIFEPFFTTKSVGKGTGLGLSLAYGIIKKHGGIITVGSEAGRGTAFDVYLPVVQAPQKDDATTDFRQIQTQQGTLLIVDDEPDVLNTIRNLLSTFGYAIHTANGGAQAIEIFREKHGEIDAVLLDMIMPDVDGRDVFHAVRDIDPRARVILVSGYNIEGHVDELMNEGAFAYVQKPFDINELCNTIYKALSNSSES